ncbi:MAG: MmgE/PrpD family protein [Betaproteobacteria bacterium]|nr:MmgE/PrpD family protein [Betaproteobacteria bacterium]
MSPTYLEKMTDFVSGLKLNDVPGDVRNNTGLFLLDAIGVAIANRKKPFVLLQANAIDRTIKEGSCTVIGHAQAFVAEGAAQLNSTAIHGNDFDATHLPSIMHTSSVVFPTAMAVAEEVGATGAEFVASAVAGCEVLIRMGLATQGAMHRLGFQSTALCAPVALALVAGRLYNMPREQIVSAAGLAASLAAGLRAFSDDGTWGKRVITGWACRAALMATSLAREGYPGTPDALEKEPFGLYKAFVQAGGYDLTELTRGLGEEWVSREIDLKRYPCSHGHHAFLDTARRAKRELNLCPEDIESVMVYVSTEARKWWFEPRSKKYDLANVYGARFSMPYTIALALQFGNLYDEHLDDRKVLQSPELQNLVTRITPKIDDTLSNSNPNRLPGTIEIRTADGRTCKFVGAGHVSSGEAFRNAVLDKYWLNVANLERGVSEQVISLATDIEKQPSIVPLMRLLRI